MASSLSPAPPVKPCLAEDSVELNYKQALDGDEQQPLNTTASKAPNRKLSTCPRAHCNSDEERLVKNSRVLFSGVLGHMVSAAFWSNVGFKLHTFFFQMVVEKSMHSVVILGSVDADADANGRVYCLQPAIPASKAHQPCLSQKVLPFGPRTRNFKRDCAKVKAKPAEKKKPVWCALAGPRKWFRVGV